MLQQASMNNRSAYTMNIMLGLSTTLCFPHVHDDLPGVRWKCAHLSRLLIRHGRERFSDAIRQMPVWYSEVRCKTEIFHTMHNPRPRTDDELHMFTRDIDVLSRTEAMHDHSARVRHRKPALFADTKETDGNGANRHPRWRCAGLMLSLIYALVLPWKTHNQMRWPYWSVWSQWLVVQTGDHAFYLRDDYIWIKHHLKFAVVDVVGCVESNAGVVWQCQHKAMSRIKNCALFGDVYHF